MSDSSPREACSFCGLEGGELRWVQAERERSLIQGERPPAVQLCGVCDLIGPVAADPAYFSSSTVTIMRALARVTHGLIGEVRGFRILAARRLTRRTEGELNDGTEGQVKDPEAPHRSEDR